MLMVTCRVAALLHSQEHPVRGPCSPCWSERSRKLAADFCVGGPNKARVD